MLISLSTSFTISLCSVLPPTTPSSQAFVSPRLLWQEFLRLPVLLYLYFIATYPYFPFSFGSLMARLYSFMLSKEQQSLILDKSFLAFRFTEPKLACQQLEIQ